MKFSIPMNNLRIVVKWKKSEKFYSRRKLVITWDILIFVFQVSAESQKRVFDSSLNT